MSQLAVLSSVASPSVPSVSSAPSDSSLGKPPRIEIEQSVERILHQLSLLLKANLENDRAGASRIFEKVSSAVAAESDQSIVRHISERMQQSDNGVLDVLISVVKCAVKRCQVISGGGGLDRYDLVLLLGPAMESVAQRGGIGARRIQSCISTWIDSGVFTRDEAKSMGLIDILAKASRRKEVPSITLQAEDEFSNGSRHRKEERYKRRSILRREKLIRRRMKQKMSVATG